MVLVDVDLDGDKDVLMALDCCREIVFIENLGTAPQ